MAKRKRKPNTGELIWRKNGYSARYRTVVDGVSIRRCVPLGTDNKAVAQAKLNRLIAGSSAPETVATETETFEQAARRIVAEQTIKTADERIRRLEMYTFPSIGKRQVDGLKASDFRAILEDVVSRGLTKGTIIHLRQDMSSVMGTLWEYEVIPENPVKRTRIPKNAKVDERPRVILTDSEFAQFLSWTDLDPELRLLALVARCFGGMRTSDLHAWDWKHVDTHNWIDAHVPRPKTKTKDRLGLPALITPDLQAWWKAAGCPAKGLVFPKWRTAAGGQRTNTSHAKRLRKALWEAGVRRGPTIETCALQTDTEDTRRVDFHSFRRAFNTALAAADVNIQKAMKLAGHKNAATHSRYVLLAESLEMPAAALPDLTRAPIVPMLEDMLHLSHRNHSVNGALDAVTSCRLTAHNYSDLVSPGHLNGPGESAPDVLVPTARAQAADAALSAYLKVFATWLAQRSAS